MDWTDIARQLAEALLVAADDLFGAVREERLRALSLVTEDGAMSVGLAVDTEAALRTRLDAARAEEGGLSSQDEPAYRWSVAEWRDEGWRDDLFVAVNRRLTEETLDGGIADMATHLGRLVEVMTGTLEVLRREREAALADVTLFVTLTDSDEAEAVENASAARLNPPAVLSRFLERYD